MIENVIFDVGNVLYRWHPRFLFQKIIDDAGELDHFLSEVLTLDWHFQHDQGHNFGDTSAALIEQHPQHEDYIRQFGPRFNETNGGPVAGSLEILRELDSRDVPLFAITNFSHEFYPPFARQHAEIFDRFRDVVVSGAEKLVKPDAAIYALAVNRFDIACDTAIFIDDNLANVEGASFYRCHGVA
ncbi:MAG: HAD-IA family hydrolase [Sphingorhabdus sp.]